jgi:chlorinating enzyme
MASLAPDQVRSFRENGYLAPLPVLSAPELAVARENLDALMRKTDGLADPASRHKPHLYAKWVSDLVRDPRVLDAVEGLIGPNLLVWRSVFFVKKPHSPGFVDWHQDSAYWYLSSDDVVTVWIALTESTVGNGCVRVVPGSHLEPEVRHKIRFAADNLLVRGQRAEVDVPEERIRFMELSPGEMSVHHVRTLHGSGANASSGDRVGFAIRYLSTKVRRLDRRQSATLVRGEDTYGHFDLETEPRFDDDPVALAWHRKSARAYASELAREALRRPGASGLASAARLMAHPGRLARALWSLWQPARPADKRLPRSGTE